MSRTCGWDGRDKKCIQNFGGKLLGRRLLGIPRRKLKDNIKMGFKEVLCYGGGVDGSCPMVGFGISGVEPSCFTTTLLFVTTCYLD
jgi:hypothetical protein